VAYFYVKNSLGTRTTGGGLTQQTGSFTTLGAASVYATIAAAITDGAVAGDHILCSDLHDFDSTSTTITYNGPTTGFLAIISVDDANCDQYSAGAIEQTTSGSSADVSIVGMISAWGMRFSPIDDFVTTSAGSQFKGYACTIGPFNAADSIRPLQDGQLIELHDCSVLAGHASARLFVSEYGSIFRMFGGSYTRDGGGLITNLSSGGFQGGGSTYELYGVDLTDVDSYLFAGVGSSFVSDDRMVIIMDLCQLSSAVDSSDLYFDEDFAKPVNDIRITRCSSASSDAEYRYYRKDFGGVIQDDTAFYRDGSTAFEDSGQKVSLKVVTDADATLFAPVAFDFPTIFAALSAASTDTLRIYILSADTLTDNDIWAEAIYPDGTTKNVGNVATSNGNTITGSFVVDPLSTGTALTANTEAWTGRTTENRYQIDIDTSGDVGADCVPLIRLYVAKASSTIYVDTTVDVVA
jgi:hypothetical protein